MDKTIVWDKNVKTINLWNSSVIDSFIVQIPTGLPGSGATANSFTARPCLKTLKDERSPAAHSVYICGLPSPFIFIIN